MTLTVEGVAAQLTKNGAPKETDQHLTPEPLQDADLTVAVTFPDIAWSSFFGRWRDTVAPCTEAPLEMLWAAGLLAAGLVIGRRAYRESPRPLFPNFYILNLGQ